MPALQTIAYVSSATRLFAEQQLESVQNEARGSNLENDITGVLLYSDGNFMQCLEGPVEPPRLRAVSGSPGLALGPDERRHRTSVDVCSLDLGVTCRVCVIWDVWSTNSENLISSSPVLYED